MGTTTTGKIVKETAKLATPQQHLKITAVAGAIALTAAGMNTLINHPHLTLATWLALVVMALFITTATQAQRTVLQARATAARRKNAKRQQPTL